MSCIVAVACASPVLLNTNVPPVGIASVSVELVIASILCVELNCTVIASPLILNTSPFTDDTPSVPDADVPSNVISVFVLAINPFES